MRRRRTAIATTAAIAVTGIAVATMAVAYDGTPAAEVDLNDGGVWITKQSALLVGHVNPSASVVDGVARSQAADYDVLQSGSDVLITSAGQIGVLDPVSYTVRGSVAVPSTAEVSLGGGTVTVHDTATGDLWVMPVSALASFSPSMPVERTLDSGSAVVVDRTGTVHAVSAESGELTSIRVSPMGSVGAAETRALEGIDPQDELTISAVGSEPVVLDRTSRTLYTARGLRAELPADAEGPALVLQQPSDDDPAVRVASPDAVITVQLAGGAVTERAPATPGGSPAAPVRLAGCTYAAWGGTAAFLRECADDAELIDTTIEGVGPQVALTFRVNRQSVLLNDTINGVAWMLDSALQRIDNWNDLTPPDGESDERGESSRDTPEQAQPERGEENTDPVANDDAYGVRAGRATVLPVLENDSDADGDVLTVSVESPSTQLGTVRPILNAQALQLDVPESADGTMTVPYAVDDGRGGTGSATVTVTVHPPSQNGAPEQVRADQIIPVEAGAATTYNLLPDWRDPDGDDIYLQSAVAADGDEVSFTPDGRVTFRAIGGSSGPVDVQIVLSDGAASASGVLRFDVRAPGSTSPVTNPDHVIARVGEQVTVSPLVNDLSAGQDVLKLSLVQEHATATVVPDYLNGSFSFRADSLGTRYVTYRVSAGSASASGVVRIDVIDAAGAAQPPIAVQDTALLPVGGEVLTGVLENDVDPAGGVLVVQSVTTDNPGIAISLVNNQTLRIADAGLSQQTRVRYVISNGSQSAEGDVIVIPLQPSTGQEAPEATPDVVVVRAGDAATAHVLDNDSSPIHSPLTLSRELRDVVPADAADQIFVSGDTVRFRAGAQPGEVRARYEVADALGQRVSGDVTFQVLPVDEAGNAAPTPRDLTARVIAGGVVAIAVPLDGIDPEGDSVELVGITTAPTRGRVIATVDDRIEYEAFADSAGTDLFTYRVRDRLGAEAVATVRVGIAGALPDNQAPFAVADHVIAAPGRVIDVSPLDNDSDPDGDTPLTLIADALAVPADIPGLEARVDGGRVVITTPDLPEGEKVRTALQYTAQDSRGATAVGVIDLTVDSTVPPQPPLARDDRIRLEQVPDDRVVSVDVRANDSDPDGTTDALTVSLPEPTTAELGAGQSIRVTVETQRQLIPYTVTDADGLQDSAFLFVPALGDLRPELSPTAGAVTVRSGELVTVELADHVRTQGDLPVMIADRDQVSALHDDGSGLIVDDRTLQYRSRVDYSGSDALTVLVTDGTTADDPGGRTALLSIPVTVLPADTSNTPPTFSGATITVPRGEAPTTLSLTDLTRDPDDGDLAAMHYALLGSAPDGITAAVTGEALSVSAPADGVVGLVGSVTVTATDGKSDPVAATFQIRTTRTERPLAVAVADVVTDAVAGVARTIDVTANDTNPYPDTPLRVVAATLLAGEGAVTFEGAAVTVTPDAGFTGTLTVRYRIADGSDDAAREVDGLLSVTVRDRPSAPGRPTVGGLTENSVMLSWSPPESNGSPITGYTVSSEDGSVTMSCESTACTIGGLVAGRDYRFQVTATNAVGTSSPSALSDTVRPQARPAAPGQLSIAADDGVIVAGWAASAPPVTLYNVEISPAPPTGSAVQTVRAANASFTGLQNGVSYTFRVQATTDAGVSSDWSAPSSPATPSGPPSAPAAPTVVVGAPTDTGATLSVQWQAPAANGSPITGYVLTVIRDGAQLTQISSATASVDYHVAGTRELYSFSVVAVNGRGPGPSSPQSAPVNAIATPGQPSGIGLLSGDGRVILRSFAAVAGNGADPSQIEYEYALNGAPWQPLPGGTQGGAIPANNGTAYSVRVRAVTVVDGNRYPGPASADSNSVVPAGPPAPPSASAEVNRTQVTLTWSPGASNGSPVTNVTWQLSGGQEQIDVPSGTTTFDVGWNFDGSVTLWAIDANHAKSQPTVVPVKTGPDPSTVTLGTLALGNDVTLDDGRPGQDVVYHGIYGTGSVAYECVVNGTVTVRYDRPAPTNTTVGLPYCRGAAGDEIWLVIEWESGSPYAPRTLSNSCRPFDSCSTGRKSE
ncbi:Ig-like domain-containing protein [Microbacterium sp. GXS0129]|uniref:Ig-like domain-containing protein n=1 Tax=Microbacterium sp. GXS0129 TaxID=3377836 RepID=UPI003839F753